MYALAAAAAVRARADAPDSTGAASKAGATPLHLADALSLAARGNPAVLTARAQVDQASGAWHTAREHPNPVVSASSVHVHADGHDATDAGNSLWSRAYDSIVSVGQEFEIGGKRAARRYAAAADVDAARAEFADTQRTIAAAVTRAYVQAALAEARTRIVRESAAYLGDEAAIADERFRAGDISRSDRDQIAIGAERLELQARTEAADARTQRIALATLLGGANAGDIAIADSLETLAAAALNPLEPVPAGERADVIAAKAALRRAEGELHLERARRLPDVTLFLQAEHEPPDRPNSFGGGVSLPLPLWNRNGGAVARATADREQAVIGVRQAGVQAEADVAAAGEAYAEAAARWQRYRDELRPQSGSIRTAVSLAYERGGASLVDLLEAQRNDNDVRLDTLQAAADAAIAAASLRAATATTIQEEQRP